MKSASPQTDAEYARHPIMDTQTHQDAVLRSFAANLEERGQAQLDDMTAKAESFCQQLRDTHAKIKQLEDLRATVRNASHNLYDMGGLVKSFSPNSEMGKMMEELARALSKAADV